MTKDEHEKYLRTIGYTTLFSVSLFLGECVAAVVMNDHTWLYIALLPLAALILGTVILTSSKDGEE